MKVHSQKHISLTIALVALGAIFITSCSSVSPQVKSNLRKVVVVNGLSSEVTRYHIGFTVFTNKAAPKSNVPELRSRLDALLAQELKRRLPNSQVVFDHASGQKLASIKHYKDISALKASMAQQSGADALVVVTSHEYYPYGIAGGMTAANGLWHSGSLGAGTTVAESFVTLTMVDAKTQKTLGSGWPMAATTVVEVPFPAEGADFTPQDRAKVVDTLMASITQKVTKTLDQAGL
jgi:hypothetical protein